LPELLRQTLEIVKAFPALNNDFIDVLHRRIKEKNFSDTRLIDAVNHVIDTCVYPTPTVASFIGFNKYTELLTYGDMMKGLADDKDIFNRYDTVKIEGVTKAMYAKKEDIEKYNFMRWEGNA